MRKMSFEDNFFKDIGLKYENIYKIYSKINLVN